MCVVKDERRCCSVARAAVSMWQCASVGGWLVFLDLCLCAVYVGGGLWWRCVSPFLVVVNHCVLIVLVSVSSEERSKVIVDFACVPYHGGSGMAVVVVVSLRCMCWNSCVRGMVLCGKCWVICCCWGGYVVGG